MATYSDLRVLPGPATQSKRIAMESGDRRMQHMLRVAAETGWPQAYCDDLYVHDLRILSEDPEGEFIWILREHGTSLLPIADCKWAVVSHRDGCRYWNGNHRLNYNDGIPLARFYHVRSTGIEELTCEQACERFREAV